MVIRTDCRGLCVNTPTAIMLSPPCYDCGGNPVPPAAPGAGETVQNTPPNVLALNPAAPQYFLVGTGIPAEYTEFSDDGVAQVFLAPLHAGDHAIGPGVNGAYTFERDEITDDLAAVFGVLLLSGSNIAITDYYDVVLSVTASGTTVKLTLTPDASAPSGYAWVSDLVPSYRIVDSVSDDSGLMVQNVIRLDHLIDAGLPPTATDDGASVWELKATRKDGGPYPFTPVSTITVATTTIPVLAPVAFSFTSGSSGGDIGFHKGVFGSLNNEPLAGFPLIEMANRSNQNFQVAFEGDCETILTGYQPVITGITLTPLSPPPAPVWTFDGTNTTGNFTTPNSLSDNQIYNVTWANA